MLAPRATGEIAALINDGNGVFSTSLSFGTISGPGDAAVADLNSDGQLDIVAFLLFAASAEFLWHCCSDLHSY